MARGSGTKAEKVAPSRRGRPRSREASSAILDSAYALMASEGLAATTIDAIAKRSGVSKMTIYKWWPSREALLIDAFLNQARLTLPLTGPGTAGARLRRHATTYAAALRGEFGRVQLAVVAECIANTGSAGLFFTRYLQQRRAAIAAIIAEGQSDGSIGATGAPGDLYDALYGSLFYRHAFGIKPLSAAAVRQLVETLLQPKL